METTSNRSPYQIIVYLVSAWDTFHRRPMLEALARNAVGQANVLLVNPMLSLRELAGARRRPGLRRLSENLALLTPVMWLPGARRLPWLTEMGNRTLAPQIERALSRTGSPDARRIEWVFRPEQVSMVGLAHGSFVVYECYDEYTRSFNNGEFIPSVAQQEETLLKKAGLVLTTSESLYQSRSSRHPHVAYTPNGVDYELFTRARDPALPIAQELRSVPSPRIGFVGNASEGLLDYPLIEELFRRHPEWSLVLMGPADEISRETRHRLDSLSNLHFLGWVERHRLPPFLKGFDVTLIPFRIQQWNAARNPLKLWEYLAAGKPVVATRNPEIENHADVLYLASTPLEFEAAICTALEHPAPERIQRGTELSMKHSWDRLTAQVLNQVLAASSASLASGTLP